MAVEKRDGVAVEGNGESRQVLCKKGELNANGKKAECREEKGGSSGKGKGPLSMGEGSSPTTMTGHEYR